MTTTMTMPTQCLTCGHTWPAGTSGEHSCYAVTRTRLELCERELRRLREWVAMARAQAITVDLPTGAMVMLPYSFMRGEP